MKLDLKKMSGAICSRDKRKGSCEWSSNSRGAFGSSNKRNKTEEYKAPKGRIKFESDEEAVASGGGRRNDSYEGDFPGDIAPAGFGGGEGKKGTRWRTTEKSGTKYVGQNENIDNPAARLSKKQLDRIAKQKGQKSSEPFLNAERFKNTPGLPK
jgi:hypothetical protein